MDSKNDDNDPIALLVDAIKNHHSPSLAWAIESTHGKDPLRVAWATSTRPDAMLWLLHRFGRDWVPDICACTRCSPPPPEPLPREPKPLPENWEDLCDDWITRDQFDVPDDDDDCDLDYLHRRSAEDRQWIADLIRKEGPPPPSFAEVLSTFWGRADEQPAVEPRS